MIRIDTLKELSPACYNDLKSWLTACYREYEDEPDFIITDSDGRDMDNAILDDENHLRNALLLHILLEDFSKNMYGRNDINIEFTRNDGYHIKIDTNPTRLVYASGRENYNISHALISALIEHKKCRKEPAEI